MIRTLDILLYDGSLHNATKLVSDACLDALPKLSLCVSATGAHGLVEAKTNPAFGSLLSGFALNLPDGMPVVWLGHLKGARSMERCYGPDFFRDVMIATADLPVNHFFCGGKEGVADDLKQAAAKVFGNSNCVGTYCPPFRDLTADEWKDLTCKIVASQADIVWVGLSTPKQEMFAHELSSRVNVHFIITVGAAFDIHTGRLRQAPHAMQRLGLEWLFRLVMEPRRLWRRYVKVVPLFLFYSVKDLLTSKGSKNDG